MNNITLNTNSNNKKEIDIFSYTDYKTFLKDYYIFRKNKNQHFSSRSFAQQTGVAPSVMKDVTSGRRNLTIPVMQRYAEAMKLTTREIRYFEILVRFVNSKNNTDKNDAFVEMIRMRGKAGIRFLGEEHYEFFSKWYHSAIRELVTLPDFREDPAWIAQKLFPPITPAQARKSLELLVSIGILTRDKNGVLIQKDALISSEYEMASAALRTFQTQMIELAGNAVEQVPRQQREISSLTLGVSEKFFLRIKERIRIFKEEILGMAVEDKSDSETVYQLNFQFFPLVVNKEKEVLPVDGKDEKND